MDTAVVATERPVDTKPHNSVPNQSIRSMLRYQNFFKHLREACKEGLLSKSLAANDVEDNRWQWTLECPFFEPYDQLKEWANEARSLATNCSTIAREKTANGLFKMIPYFISNTANENT